MRNDTTTHEQQEQQPVYLIVFAILAIFTALEVGSSYLTDLPLAIRIGLLVFLAAVKVGLVLLYFMHLRFDNRIFALPVALGVVLIIPFLLIVTLTTNPGGTSPGGQASSGGNGGGSQTVDVTEESYNISLSTNTVQPGAVTFHITNKASQMPHELLIIRTDSAPDQLPTDSSGNVDEGQVDIVAQAQDIQPGSSQDVSVDLQAGHYVLICNIPGHYSQGMRVGLTVGSGDSSASNPTATPESTAPADSAMVTVVEKTFSIEVSPASVAPGSVTFQISNEATDLPHELLIVRSDSPADALPTDENGDLIQSQLDIIDSVEGIPPGERRTLTVDLDAGHYALVCNIPNHYHEGMYADFTVGTNAEATAEATPEASASSTTPTPAPPMTTEEASN